MTDNQQDITVGQLDHTDASHGNTLIPPSPPPPQSGTVALLKAMMLYGLAIPLLLTGSVMIGTYHVSGLGLLATAALLMPITRRLGYRLTGYKLSREALLLLLLAVPIASIVAQVAMIEIKEQKLRDQIQRQELLATKPAVMDKIRTAMSKGAYSAVLAFAEPLDALRDTDIEAAKAEAKRQIGAATAEHAEAAKRREEDRCTSDLDCYASKYQGQAGKDCRRSIEKMARNNFEWTNGTFEPILPRAVWLNKSRKLITYVGDRIKFQNGFGAWIIHTYECDYSPEDRRVLAVRASPGQL